MVQDVYLSPVLYEEMMSHTALPFKSVDQFLLPPSVIWRIFLFISRISKSQYRPLGSSLEHDRRDKTVG